MNLFFDTETSGLFDFKSPPEAAHQPRLVQLGAVLDSDHTVLSSINTLVLPEGFSIPKEATAVHGISTEQALASGIPLKDALTQFYAACMQADLLVAHNSSYDVKVLTGEYIRAGMESPFSKRQVFCTMIKSTSICKIPGKRGGYKWPTLDEAYRMLVDEDGFTGAHDAMADVLACREVYYKLVPTS